MSRAETELIGHEGGAELTSRFAATGTIGEAALGNAFSAKGDPNAALGPLPLSGSRPKIAQRHATVSSMAPGSAA